MENAQASPMKSWVQEFFGTTWAKSVSLGTWVIVSAWIWFGNLLLDGDSNPKPFTWFGSQIESVGWEVPNWFNSIAEAEKLTNIWWLQAGLLVAAVLLSLFSATNVAPGYQSAATLALLLSFEWFGIGITMVYYGLSIAVVSMVALAMVRWGNYSVFDVKLVKATVVRRLVQGPGLMIGIPFLLPILCVLIAAKAVGFPGENSGEPLEVTMLKSIEKRCSDEPGSALQMSAKDCMLLETASRIVANSDPSKIKRAAAYLQVASGSGVPRDRYKTT